MSIQNILLRIQEEAERKTAETVEKYGLVVSSPHVDLKLIQDEILGAVARKIFAKVSHNFVGDLLEDIHNIVTDSIRQLKYSFDRHVSQTENGQITLFPKNCRFSCRMKKVEQSLLKMNLSCE